jgi:D-xylose 1-dehydrogenase (NADP+, D-xylono-1,5-lactone-forming)
VRWGVLSTAAINELVLPGFGRSDRADLEAVASRDRERAESYARENGIPRAHGSYEDLLADPEVDCLYISLPNGLHGEWTRRALEAGKHVLCEKPLTPSAREAASLFALADERGLMLMEAFMYRHHPQTLRAEELVREGAVGVPEVVRSWFHFTVEDPGTDIRYSEELAGGALRDVGCYCVSFSNHLLGGEPGDVAAVAHLSESGVDEWFAGSMLYPGGAVATFDCGMQAPLDIGLTVLGSEGSLHIPTPWYPHQPPMKLILTRHGESEDVPAAGEDSYFLEIENFTAAAAGDGEPRVSAAETLRNLETIERLRLAAGLDRQERASADPEPPT